MQLLLEKHFSHIDKILSCSHEIIKEQASIMKGLIDNKIQTL